MEPCLGKSRTNNLQSLLPHTLGRPASRNTGRGSAIHVHGETPDPGGGAFGGPVDLDRIGYAELARRIDLNGNVVDVVTLFQATCDEAR